MNQEIAKDFEQTYTVTLQPIHDAAQKKIISEALSRIDEMNKQLDYFYNEIHTGYGNTIALLEKLQAAHIVQEEPRREYTDRSVITYLELLQAIKGEIARERAILDAIQTATEERTIEVNEPVPANYQEFVAQRVKGAKTQTKKIESSLRISFSRYQYWITQTTNRLRHFAQEATNS